MNVKEIIEELKKIDKKVNKIMLNGIKFSFVFCLIASLVLGTYCENFNPISYNIGISLLKSGVLFIVTFVICGVAFNKIVKDLN